MDTHLTVIVADDHNFFTEGFITALDKLTDIKVLGKAANGKELIELTDELKPDVVITDIAMPVCDGIEATRMLHKKHPVLGIIALTTFCHEEKVKEIIAAGARGYLMKTADLNEIIDAIKKIKSGGSYYTPIVQDMINNLFQNPITPQKKVHFTQREEQVLDLICRQYTNVEIADILGLGKRTVEEHRLTLLKKTGSKNTVGIVMYAMKEGIFQG